MALGELQQLASVADRFQITEVVCAVEETLLLQLCVVKCGELLMWSGRCGMQRLEAEALKMAVERFEEFATTAGFMQMGGEALGRVLDDDRVVTRSEEAVWEAVAGWMRGAAGDVGWRGVAGKSRFPLLGEEYLGSHVLGMVGGEDGEWLAGVVAEALRAKAAWWEGAEFEFELLGRKALDDRVGLGVRWQEQRMGGHEDAVSAIVGCEGRICSGSRDGLIRIWSRASGEHERTLQADADEEEADSDDGKFDPVYALAVWEGRLISSHESGNLRVWNVATGTCDQVLAGHDNAVWALAVWGSRLASGSRDRAVAVWARGPGGLWARERTLLGHTGGVYSLAGWRHKLASGSSDGSIRVWDAETGAHDATLAGHAGAVIALVAHRDRLLSASHDGTIRAWATGTWAALRAVEAYGAETMRCTRCLAVSGSTLVSGSKLKVGSMAHSPQQEEVRVWGLRDLDLRQTLRQPAGASVGALAAVDGEVWGGVGKDVVAWGRRP